MAETRSGLDQARVLLAVTGGIAAYKAPELVRLLVKEGALVSVILTRNARRFVTRDALRAVTRGPVLSNLFEAQALGEGPWFPGSGPSSLGMAHIGMAREADLLLVAPATANLLAKLAHGLADDLLSTALLATRSPVLVAPAMNVAMWEHTATMPLVGAPREFGDPILFTDHDTGRTFFGQLLGLTPAGSTTEITDDDGRTFIPSQGSGLQTTIDHETFGGGPFAAPLPPGAVYKNAIYYCSQQGVDSGGNGLAECALSADGGVTFGPGVPIYAFSGCSGLHGHLKVSPKDGTVYVPNAICGTTQGVLVSENNGITWTLRTVTGSTAGPKA